MEKLGYIIDTIATSSSIDRLKIVDMIAQINEMVDDISITSPSILDVTNLYISYLMITDASTGIPIISTTNRAEANFHQDTLLTNMFLYEINIFYETNF